MLSTTTMLRNISIGTIPRSLFSPLNLLTYCDLSYLDLCETRMPQKLEEPEELAEPLSRPTSWDELSVSFSYSA